MSRWRKAGLVAVPINFRLTAPEIEYIVTNCEARAIVVQDALVKASNRCARICRDRARRRGSTWASSARRAAGAATRR